MRVRGRGARATRNLCNNSVGRLGFANDRRLTTDDWFMALREVLKEIEQRNRFLLTSHARPDGDAIGSELGLARLLRGLGKGAVVWNHDPTPTIYKPLPGSERAPTLAEVHAVCMAGDVMPEKSTYFYPKLVSGLVFLEL